ncbi:hypothetical protein, partial [Nocardia brasiliensis]|uniref:hypothetical protein n=1 Tax=Nocardia brasiliensis TaxID=37326 RepID=UPI00245844FB
MRSTQKRARRANTCPAPKYEEHGQHRRPDRVGGELRSIERHADPAAALRERHRGRLAHECGRRGRLPVAPARQANTCP